MTVLAKKIAGFISFTGLSALLKLVIIESLLLTLLLLLLPANSPRVGIT